MMKENVQLQLKVIVRELVTLIWSLLLEHFKLKREIHLREMMQR